jgi:hypothetical protein
LTKNWSPKDLLSTKHLLKERDIIEAKRVARNATAGSWLPYKAGWTFGPVRDYEIWTLGDKVRDRDSTTLNRYWLAVDEFETPDDRYYLPGPPAKDYSDASEGAGQVTVRGSNYDIEEAEVFSPYDASVRYRNHDGGWKCKRRATADEEDCLGLDTESDLVEKMTDAVKAWAGMTTPPPKAADPTVEALIQTYLANGGEVHTHIAYQTTPKSRIKFKVSFCPAWAGGTGIPPEMRNKKKLFRVRPQTGSKLWSNTV